MIKTMALCVTIGWLAAHAAVAGETCKAPADCGAAKACDEHQGHACGTCPRCGNDLVCQVVCTTKEIKKTVWTVPCEPFCVPRPACPLGAGRCENADGDGQSGCPETACANGPCAVENAKNYFPPKCGDVRCKKTLVKKEVVCKVPSYKCVPTCPHCGCNGGKAPVPAKPSVPAKPLAPMKTADEAPMPPLAR